MKMILGLSLLVGSTLSLSAHAQGAAGAELETFGIRCIEQVNGTCIRAVNKASAVVEVVNGGFVNCVNKVCTNLNIPVPAGLKSSAGTNRTGSELMSQIEGQEGIHANPASNAAAANSAKASQVDTRTSTVFRVTNGKQYVTPVTEKNAAPMNRLAKVFEKGNYKIVRTPTLPKNALTYNGMAAPNQGLREVAFSDTAIAAIIKREEACAGDQKCLAALEKDGQAVVNCLNQPNAEVKTLFSAPSGGSHL